MATATLTTIASLDDLAAHPLVTYVVSEEETESPYRFHLENGVCDDFATDADVLSMAALFISDGLPFTVTEQQPVDQDALDAEARQYDRDMAALWAAHGPGR